VDFGGLAVWVPGGDAVCKGLKVEQVQRHGCERTCEGVFASALLLIW
jgi:hypothetical protein